MAICFGNPEMQRKPRSTDWTEQQLSQLRTLASEGMTWDEIAPRIGRTALATERKGKQLGIWPKRDQFWSNSEITELRRLATTHTQAEAAPALGRSVGSVHLKAMRLGISFQKYGEANRSTIYTTDDIRQVFEMRSKGATLKEISAATGMNFSHAADILNYEVRYRESLTHLNRRIEHGPDNEDDHQHQTQRHAARC